MPNYSALNPEKIVDTLHKLNSRIRDRFPNAGLGGMCDATIEAAEASARRANFLARPALGIRLLVFVLLVCCCSLLAGCVAFMALLAGQIDYRPFLFAVWHGADLGRSAGDAANMLPAVDALVHITLVFGAFLLIVLGLEGRSKRAAALGDLHKLRSLMHIIDMHQLTKNPFAVLGIGAPTPNSPVNTFTPYELARYLDYCTEMLSLTAKIAALYAQSSRDSLVISTVNDLEQLAANLSVKISQKIALLGAEAAAPMQVADPASTLAPLQGQPAAAPAKPAPVVPAGAA